MKSRRLILGAIAVAALITGFLEYTIGSHVNPNDWQNRGIYTDMLRPLLLPMLIGFMILFVVIGLYSAGKQDDQDMRVSN
ncbi:hypothetical protein GCM10027037_32990 [Mucilaginibacter koreensis]